MYILYTVCSSFVCTKHIVPVTRTHNDTVPLACSRWLQPAEVVVEKPKNKYALKDPPDLQSTFLLEVDERNEMLAHADERRIEAELAEQRKLAEQLPPDASHGKRVHAWVMILIAGDAEPAAKMPAAEVQEAADGGRLDEDGNSGGGGEAGEQVEPDESPLTVIFIEPSTGFAIEANDPRYLGIESVWNPENYYVSGCAMFGITLHSRSYHSLQVNLQEPITNIADMKFKLADTGAWEHLLPGEPAEQRVACPLPDDVDKLTYAEELASEKHLTMPTSWVNQLNISWRGVNLHN